MQNSWAGDWGFNGFAILTYEDWVQNGMDAWAAALGVPACATVPNGSGEVSSTVFREAAFGVVDRNGLAGKWFFGGGGDKATSYKYKNPSVAPWNDERAFHHLLVMGNNGQPLNRLVSSENAEAAVAQVCETLAGEWLAGQTHKKLVIYAHGGLNSEEAALNRTRILAPYFFENGIYPVFVAWRTGLLETLGQIFKDSLPDVSALMGQPAGGLSGDLGGLFHLVGYSAGSILHGHLLDLLRHAKLQVASCTLFAPACTVRFALEYYGKAITGGTLAPDDLFVEILSEEREQADSVGPYGKSLLYLVSRALEGFHKMPLLGKTLEWTETDSDKRAQLFGPAGSADVAAWQAFVKQQQLNAPTLCRSPTVSDGLGRIPAAHGSFDNDVAVITRTIERTKGAKAKPAVECLRGF